MNTFDTRSVESSVPSLFQVATYFEDFFPSQNFKQPAVAKHSLPVAEYLLNPQKLMSLLRPAKAINTEVAELPAKQQTKAKIRSRIRTRILSRVKNAVINGA